MSAMAKNRFKSSWTPLNNSETNNKLFEERKHLVNIWFDKWTDVQRRILLEELVLKCKPKQLEHLDEVVGKTKPIKKVDFTTVLPRVLSVYIFSFLDPRSLCRCSQVSWHWKNITELDQIWMSKCVKLGWLLPFTPDPYEIGVWKRHYIENIIILKCMTPAKPKSSRTPRTPKSQSKPNSARERRSSSASRPPWKGSDPVPKDIWRNNYLDNKDEVGIVKKLRETGKYFNQETIVKKVNTGKHAQIPRSKSVTTGEINKYTGERPSWAMTNGNSTLAFELNASRPAPVQSQPRLRPKSGRSNRDPPSEPLFTDRPWNLINDDDEC